MPIGWADLAGPRRFIERVAGDLRQRVSTVVLLPRHGVPDIGEGIRRAASDVLMDRVSVAQATEASGLAMALGRELVVGGLAAGPSPVDTLAGHEDVAGRTILVEESADVPWSVWVDFLSQFARCTQGIAEWERPALCLILRGGAPEATLADTVTLRCHRWAGAVSEADMYLWAYLAIEAHEGRSPLARRLAAMVVANLAGWDLELATALAEEPIERLADPRAYLAGMAHQRGWLPGAASPLEEWADGRRPQPTADAPRHAAVLAAASNPGLLDRLLWSAQVAVLFPVVEEQRQRLVRRLGRRLQPGPTESGAGNVLDLEIGQIQYQVQRASGMGLPQRIRDTIRLLRDVRNHLAHGECVPVAVMVEPDRLLLPDDF